MAVAGSQVITHDSGNPQNMQKKIRRVDIAWIADSGGSVTELAAFGINGRLVSLITTPGSPAPTTLYGVKVYNEHAVDILQGLGANRSATTPEMVSIVYSSTDVHPPVAGPCTIEVLNAGNLGAGTITLLFEQ